MGIRNWLHEQTTDDPLGEMWDKYRPSQTIPVGKGGATAKFYTIPNPVHNPSRATSTNPLRQQVLDLTTLNIPPGEMIRRDVNQAISPAWGDLWNEWLDKQDSPQSSMAPAPSISNRGKTTKNTGRVMLGSKRKRGK